MKTNVFLAIAIRIIILFTVAIIGTYLPDYLTKINPDFMNDDIKTGNWGARHIWFVIMMALLFILSLINCIVGSIKVINKNYDTEKW